MIGDEPLGRLLAMALNLVVSDLHERLAVAGFARIRPLAGFVLVSLAEASRSVGELGVLLGVSKQAAAKVVRGLEGDGLVAVRENRADRRAVVVSLTPRGRSFLRAAGNAYEEIEGEWRLIAGEAQIRTMRETIGAVLEERFGTERPPLRPAL